ncbi:MAG: PepSY domain-containing protein, partial [Acutalibacteraceae bacterium]
MKKTLKKLLAALLAVLVIIGSSAVAFAGSITQAQAEDIALKDIGISRTEASFIHTEADYENGKLTEYEVDVYVKNSNGYTEYEYEIRVSDAKILSKKTETTSAAPSSSEDIGISKAKENALEAFGLSADSVKLIKAKKEKDDATLVYEIEFCENLDVKYSCEVNAYTGVVNDMETEYSRNIFDKLELLFEIIIA